MQVSHSHANTVSTGFGNCFGGVLGCFFGVVVIVGGLIALLVMPGACERLNRDRKQHEEDRRLKTTAPEKRRGDPAEKSRPTGER